MANRFQVQGFRFSGVTAGIKEGKTPDLALIVSDVPAVVVGNFTTSKVKAAPVLVSQKNIRSGICRVVVANSGNANACTGARGLRDAEKMVRETAKALKVSEKHVLVSSTGKIGIPLPVDRLVGHLPSAVKALSPNGFLKSARAILTTDHSVKVAAAQGIIQGKPYRIAAFAKGAGMIAPKMSATGTLHATMLAYLVTDIQIDRKVLRTIFDRCVDNTFNHVSVDGDMSTNDTVLLLANGLAGNKSFSAKSREARQFEENLRQVMDDLGRQMVLDGEGATKCVKIVVKGAQTRQDAQKLIAALSTSLLVKTSFFGQDPNWGRLMGAAGRSGATLDPQRVDIHYDRVCVARRGESTGPLKDREAKKVMKKQAFQITLDCHLGRGSDWIYTSDLTLDYVKLNSCYRT